MKKPLPNWLRDDNSIIACTEKIKVMTDNMQEIAQMMQDAFEDGILMEVSETQMREVFLAQINALKNPYKKL